MSAQWHVLIKLCYLHSGMFSSSSDVCTVEPSHQALMSTLAHSHQALMFPQGHVLIKLCSLHSSLFSSSSDVRMVACFCYVLLFSFSDPTGKDRDPPLTTLAKVRGSLLTPLHKVKGPQLTPLAKVRGSLPTPLHKVRGPPLTPLAKVRGPPLKLSAAAWCFWLQNKEKPVKGKLRSRTLTSRKTGFYH